MLATGGGDVASLEFHVFPPSGHLNIFGIDIEVLEVPHGFNPDGTEFIFNGFKFGREVVYISDASKIPQSVRDKIRGCDVLVLDALGDRPHRSHLTIDQSLDEISQACPRVGIMVGFGHSVDHDSLLERLETRRDDSERITVPGYDGMRLTWDPDSSENRVSDSSLV